MPLLIDIFVALYSTKIVTFAKNGLWGTLREARRDVSMRAGQVELGGVGCLVALNVDRLARELLVLLDRLEAGSA